MAVALEVRGVNALLGDLTGRLQDGGARLERRGSRIEIRLTDPDGWTVVCWQRESSDSGTSDRCSGSAADT